MAAKQQICVRLKKEHLEQLEKLAQKHDVSKGWLIQQAVAKFLDPAKAKGK